ncbi:ferredoxin [Methylobacterium oryzae]|uniref:Ferredoxin n=1 Tax=Methylobacterium oryzae TaxID=334852 RepID=A0ABU7TXF3_9HYPH
MKPASGTAALRVVVDLNRCQGYAQCCYAAPDAFAIRGHEILFYDPAPPADRRDAIERAVQACPVRAISLQVGPDDGDAP